MIYTVIIMLLLSVIPIIRKPKNVYIYYFSLTITGIAVMLFCTIFRISTVWNYGQFYTQFMKADYKIYLYLSTIKLHTNTIHRIFNFGMLMVFAGSMIIVIRELAMLKKKRTAICYICCSVVFIVLYCWFYDPKTKLVFYSKLYNGCGSVVAVTLGLLDIMLLVFQLSALVLPLVIIIMRYRTVSIKMLKNRYIMLFTGILILDLLCISNFIVGPLKTSYLFDYSADMFFGTKIYGEYVSARFYILLSMFCCVLLQFLIIGVIRNNSFNTLSVVKKITRKNEGQGSEGDFNSTLHSIKNTFFNISLMAEKLKEQCETDGIADDIINMCDRSVTNIFSVTGIDSINFNQERNDIISVLDCAISESYIPDNIEVYKNYTHGRVLSYFDYGLIKDIFVNIIKNSIEAISAAGREHGEITVSETAEEGFVLIEIADNGCGVSDPKKVFKALYTTKSRCNNWGVGMYYCKKIIEGHLGHISICNTNNGACVSVILYVEEKSCE